jgi:hypothetical protein
MRIHIVGSRPDESTDENFSKMKSACCEIGRKLGELGWELSTGSVRCHSADLYVMKGFLKTSKKENHIKVFHQGVDEKFSNKVKKLETENNKEINVKRVSGTTSSRHIEGISEASAVLLIGGGGKTLTAGFAAPSMQKPVLALPSFGGTSKQVWDALQFTYGKSSLTESDLKKIESGWIEGNSDRVLSALQSLVQSNPFSYRISKPQWIFNIVILLFLIIWFLVFSSRYILNPHFVFFSNMVAGSMIGTGIRTLLKVYFDFSENFSPKKIVSDFMIGLVVSFCFLLLYLILGIVYDGDIDDVFNKKNISRSSVFISLVALSSSFLLERSVQNIRSKVQKYIDTDQMIEK